VRRRVVVVFVLILSISAAAWGQPAGKATLSYKLLSIQIKGLSQLPQEEVIRASGLQLGQTVTEQDFQQAVQKLGDTGLFQDVAYSYHYTPAGCDLSLQLSENDKLVPILFDNFVWFSDDELVSALKQWVVLFGGRLPLRGNMADKVSAALNSMLQERKISGEVQYLRSAALNGPIDSYVYQVKFHPIVIRNIVFPGASGDDLPLLQNAAKPLVGHEYLRSNMRPHENLDFLPIYLARGYLRAQFSDSQATVVQDGPRTVVDVNFPVTRGSQYRVTSLQWAGESAFPPEQLQHLIHLKTGEPANAIQLKEDLGQIEKLYGTKGYLLAQIQAQPIMDDGNATVAYRLNVLEGDQFRMGDLLIDGIDTKSAGELEAQWQIKKGDVYDSSYLNKFFQITYHDVGLSRSYSVVPKQDIDRQTKTVNVALHFVPKK
jgi:outer membrane protein insertion porin family